MRTLFLFFLCGTLATAQAQTQKIGYADWQYIFSQLPEFKQVESEMRVHSEQMQNTLRAKSQDFETKYKAYQQLPATTADAIRADKERELQALQEGFQKFQQDVQVSLQKKQTDLMEPIFAKMGKYIEEVAKEHGYTFIINDLKQGLGLETLMYADEAYNISNLVLKKMGITPAPAAATPATPVKKN